MLFKSILLPSVLVPAITALLVVVVTSALGRRQKPSAATPLGAPGGSAALALAFCAAYVAMNGWPRFLPVEATQRLFFFVLLAIAAGLWLRRLGNRARLIAVFLAAIPLHLQLFESQLEFRWSALEGSLWIAGLALTTTVLALGWSASVAGIDHVTQTKLVAWSPPTLWIAAIRPILLGLSAVCLGLSGSALLGQLMGALAAATAALEAWQYLRRAPVWRKSDAMVWAVAVSGLLACSYFYAELSALAACLLGLSFVLLGLGTSSNRAALRVACLLAALVATGLTVKAELAQAADDASEYDYYGAAVPMMGDEQLKALTLQRGVELGLARA